MELALVLRWVHEIAAITWFGEVFVITHIILPTLGKLSEDGRASLMVKLFPRAFRMATISSAVTIFAGLGTALLYSNFQLSLFLDTRWGLLILAGGLIGLFMFLLHVTVERVEMKALGRVKLESEREIPQELATLYRRLRILPRVGFTLLTIVLVLMIYASHGF